MRNDEFTRFPKGFPFVGTYEEFAVLNKTIDSLRIKLNDSDNPREIIFDSWFLFDYFIRRMLLKGFDIEDFENEKLDLMYEFLPQSFDLCLKSFESFLNNQREIFERKMHPNAYFKNHENTISFNGSFIAYMMNEKAELFNEFYSEYWNYLQKNDLEYFTQQNDWDYSKFKIHKVTSITWIEKCAHINNDWFKNVRKLNKCRNKAAHLYDDKYIYQEFGINGPDKLQQLKGAITDLIKQTLMFDI